MVSDKIVKDFIAQKNIAVIGVSRKKMKFGNAVYRELKQKGYTVFPINKSLDEINGEKCYKSVLDIKDKVDAAIFVVPPAVTEELVKEVKEAGIKRVWMQQGSESQQAISFCKDNGIDVIHNQCIMMFASPVKSIHGFHRWLWKIFGKLPR